MHGRHVNRVAAAVLLAGPTAIAFFSGGYFIGPRVTAAIVVWAIVLLSTPTLSLPRSKAGRAALGGLAALTVWSALSLLWAPQGGPAVQGVQRLLLYTGTVLLAASALRDRQLWRAVEPALAGGVAVVIGYGLAGRMLPGVIHLAHSASAGGRLEQPLTYWNSEGALAAIGLVLCARLAGDRSRPAAIRLTAGAIAPLLATGVYLSYSRGALAAAVLGLLVLVAAAPTRDQLTATAVVLSAGIVASVGAELLPAVTDLGAPAPDRAREGAILLALLAVLAGASALALARAPEGGAWRWSGRLPAVAWAAALAVAAGMLVGGLAERATARELSAGAGASRLTNASSNRYEYWRVALHAFEHHPLNGVGAGGFRVVWLQERRISEAVRDTHSLVFEMAAELGLVGLVGLGVMVGGTALTARHAVGRQRALAAGPMAALVVWGLHSMVDWDWEMPAATLPVLVLAGFLIPLAEDATPPPDARRVDPAAAAAPRPAAAAGGRLPPR